MQLDEYVDKTFLSVFDSDNEYSACLEDDPVLPFGAKMAASSGAIRRDGVVSLVFLEAHSHFDVTT